MATGKEHQLKIDLVDKPIAITGASSGIGKSTAILCARSGMPVALAARRIDRLEETAEAVRAEGGRATTFSLDVADERACRRFIDHTVEQFGSIHAVFANAGYGIDRPVHQTDNETVRRIFEVNFYGTLHTIRPALDRMLEAGSGHVLICSSSIAKVAIPGNAVYSATKAAQDHIGRGLRLELAGTGIHVSTVHPIGTRTEFFDVMTRGDEPSINTPEFLMQPPERVARAVIRCLQRPRGEVWTSLFARTGLALAVMAPHLADRVLGRRQSRL